MKRYVSERHHFSNTCVTVFKTLFRLVTEIVATIEVVVVETVMIDAGAVIEMTDVTGTETAHPGEIEIDVIVTTDAVAEMTDETIEVAETTVVIAAATG